jgi:hypothetical protein
MFKKPINKFEVVKTTILKDQKHNYKFSSSKNCDISKFKKSYKVFVADLDQIYEVIIDELNQIEIIDAYIDFDVYNFEELGEVYRLIKSDTGDILSVIFINKIKQLYMIHLKKDFPYPQTYWEDFSNSWIIFINKFGVVNDVFINFYGIISKKRVYRNVVLNMFDSISEDSEKSVDELNSISEDSEKSVDELNSISEDSEKSVDELNSISDRKSVV